MATTLVILVPAITVIVLGGNVVPQLFGKIMHLGFAISADILRIHSICSSSFYI